ncbi:hypothetical protein HanIR_Chr12g0592811 [Helianthus annuus]|nr:hypothetical protein HanIR_Chr12g0592811 [Helianthus annuus]
MLSDELNHHHRRRHYCWQPSYTPSSTEPPPSVWPRLVEIEMDYYQDLVIYPPPPLAYTPSSTTTAVGASSSSNHHRHITGVVVGERPANNDDYQLLRHRLACRSKRMIEREGGRGVCGVLCSK